MNHQEARDHVVEGFTRTFGRTPTLPEAQILQGIGWLETQYGAGWHGAGAGSHNWGAIQSGRAPCNPATSFEYTDTSPNPDGTSTPYRICFRKYPDDDAGAADLARVAYQRRPTVLAAASAGDIMGASTALYDTTYYQGFGPTREARIANHYKALLAAVQRIAGALGEPMPDGSAIPPRTLRLKTPYMTGDDVKRVQAAAGAKVDGVYGPDTVKAVKAFQAGRTGLAADGIVGPQTWIAIEKAEKNVTQCVCDHG
jgi:hypothetical protein